MSGLAASSRLEAPSIAFSITFSAASISTRLAMISEREPPVPPTAVSTSESPASRRIFIGSTPSSSCTIWGQAVSWPCPEDWVPTASVISPSGVTFISALSAGPPPVRSK